MQRLFFTAAKNLMKNTKSLDTLSFLKPHLSVHPCFQILKWFNLMSFNQCGNRFKCKPHEKFYKNQSKSSKDDYGDQESTTRFHMSWVLNKGLKTLLCSRKRRSKEKKELEGEIKSNFPLISKKLPNLSISQMHRFSNFLKLIRIS
jgi:hypothetical protein